MHFSGRSAELSANYKNRAPISSQERRGCHISEMEPVSLAASCLTLAGCATSLIKDLYDLRAKFKQVDRVAGLLCVQVSTLRTAIYGLSSWLERKPVSAACDSRLRNEFQQSLDACASLIMMLQAHVSHVRDSDGVITTRGKIRHILDESELKEYDRMLGVQVQALGFLVQVIQLYVLFPVRGVYLC